MTDLKDPRDTASEATVTPAAAPGLVAGSPPDQWYLALGAWFCAPQRSQPPGAPSAA